MFKKFIMKRKLIKAYKEICDVNGDKFAPNCRDSVYFNNNYNLLCDYFGYEVGLDLVSYYVDIRRLLKINNKMKLINFINELFNKNLNYSIESRCIKFINYEEFNIRHDVLQHLIKHKLEHYNTSDSKGIVELLNWVKRKTNIKCIDLNYKEDKIVILSQAGFLDLYTKLREFNKSKELCLSRSELNKIYKSYYMKCISYKYVGL